MDVETVFPQYSKLWFAAPTAITWHNTLIYYKLTPPLYKLKYGLVNYAAAGFTSEASCVYAILI